MLDAFSGSLAASIGEAYSLGFGEAVTLSAETGLGMSELHKSLKPILEEYILQYRTEDDDSDFHEDEEAELPLQLAIVGRPNVGKSTLLNAILQDRVLVGPEAGFTRDSVRVHFQYEGRDVNLDL